MELKDLLVKFNFAKNEEEAIELCYRGSVRVDGKTVSDAHYVPQEGSSLLTLENAYTVLVTVEKVGEGV